MPFRISMTDDERLDLFKMVEDALQEAQNDRRGFDRRRRAIFNAYRNRPKRREGPDSWRANHSLPIITRAVERMTVQTMQTVAPRGYFSTIAASPIAKQGVKELQDRADTVSSYMTFIFRNKMNLADEFELFVRSGIAYGNALAKVWWKRERRNVRMVERIPALARQLVEGEDPENPEAETEIIQIPVRDTIEMFFAGKDMLEIRELPEGGGYSVQFFDMEEKRRRDITVEGYYDEDTGENVLLLKGNEIVVDRPEFTFIDLDDVFFTLDEYSIKRCRQVFIRQRMSLGEIIMKYEDGVFNQLTDSDIDDLKKRVSWDKDTGETEIEITAHSRVDRVSSSNVRTRADQIEGTLTDRREDVDVWEVFLRHDIDKDGVEEEIVVWLEMNSKKVMRVAHLYEEYSTNERPLVEWGLVPNGNRTLKIGVGEMLMPLQSSLDRLFNNRMDAAAVTLMPTGVYRQGSGFYPSKMRLAPGTWWAVDNPQTDVMPFTMQANTRDTIQVEQFLGALIEDLSVSTYSFGRGPDRPNAPRTARGTLAILQQDAVKMDFILKRLAPAIEDVCHKTLKLLRIYGSDKEEFRVVGSNDVKTLEPEDLENRYSFFIDIDSVSANREIQRIYAAQAFESIGPIAGMDPAQVSSGLRMLGRNLLQKLDFKNSDQILPDPAGFQRPPQDQMMENPVLYMGVPIDPVFMEDHVSHLQEMDAEENTERWNSMPFEWVETIWKPHKQKHMQMYQQQQQMLQQMQSAGGGPGGAGMGAMGTGVETGPAAAGSSLSGEVEAL